MSKKELSDQKTHLRLKRMGLFESTSNDHKKTTGTLLHPRNTSAAGEFLIKKLTKLAAVSGEAASFLGAAVVAVTVLDKLYDKIATTDKSVSTPTPLQSKL